mgnify:CR=1 FL=1
MTVLDHMKAAGYDPNAARNADDLRRMRAGTMECESIQLRTFLNFCLSFSNSFFDSSFFFSCSRIKFAFQSIPFSSAASSFTF